MRGKGRLFLVCFCFIFEAIWAQEEGLPLFYWQENAFVNFGDYLSLKLVERIVGKPLRFYKKKNQSQEKKLLAVGSILYFASEGDVVWGSGVSWKRLNLQDYPFQKLDVRAVRGPLTRAFVQDYLGIDCPEVYGDPALLFPYFFPEFQKSQNPSQPFIVIPHYSEQRMFPKETCPWVVYPTEPWDQIMTKILDSQFVISSSLHGIILAEAFGIPARMLRISDYEPFIKYQDYYFGTNRPHFQAAHSIDEALEMGGEIPFECDLEKLYESFPFDYWPGLEKRALFQ